MDGLNDAGGADRTDWLAALDPRRSAVVEACAGSGKTWLLASRIVLALLDGAAPGEILAITFTRKAAREMRERVAAWLKTIALASDDGQVIEFLSERGIDASRARQALPQARGLYERWVTATPGATIETFHGWFLRLIELQPLQAAWDGDAQIGLTLEENGGRLMGEAWQRLAARCQADPEGAVTRSFGAMLAELGAWNVRRLLFAFAARRAEWWAYTENAADATAFACDALRERLGVDPGVDPVPAWLAAARARITAYAALRARKGEAQTRTDIDALAGIEQALQAEAQPALTTLRDVFLTAKDTTRKITVSKDASRNLAGAAESLLTEHEAIADSLRELLARQTERQLYLLNVHAFACGAALIEQLQALKATRRVLDFTDVEVRAARLLASDEHAAYIHARLDSRYRHVLLDEFQDTNPQQWRALRGWLDAYGADAQAPEVFMVGDPKQAIYRFRRADPRVFAAAAAFLREERSAIAIERNQTWRNAPAVVDVVNGVFGWREDYPLFRPQTTARPELPGMVEVLPLVAFEASAADDVPLAARDVLHEPADERTDERALAEGHAIAARLLTLVGGVLVVGADGRTRAARFDDVMLLVRKRAPVAAYERAFREAGVPFVTARLGGLLDAIEARDLVALIEFLVEPSNDLALAHALKSPVFGCTDADLIALAHTHGASWWERLETLAQAGGAPIVRAAGLLAGWIALADRLPVHDLLDRIYHHGEVLERYRAAVPAHLAARVTANLHAFIELALSIDAGRYPSLTRFIDELARWRSGEDNEAPDEGAPQAGDAVHIMTIHGAKGLEAPIVWLADAHNAMASEDAYTMLIDWPPHALRPEHMSCVFTASLRGARRDDLFAAQAREAGIESLNMLYVAMTRARQALFVSGIQPGKGENPASWYRQIETVVGAMGGPGVGALPPVAGDSAVPASDRVVPAIAVPLAIPAVGERRAPESMEIRAGKLRHLVLQQLTEDRVGDDIESLARMFALPPQAAHDAIAQAHALIEAPGLRRFFEHGQFVSARNESEIVGADGATRRADRIVEFESEVWVLDYKSRIGEVELPAYRAQVREYVALLAPLFAGKHVLGALIDIALAALIICDGPDELDH